MVGGGCDCGGDAGPMSSYRLIFINKFFRRGIVDMFPVSWRRAAATLALGSSLIFHASVPAAEPKEPAADIGATATPAATPSEAPDAASPAGARLISQAQYANTLAYVFGPDIRVSAHFAPFRRTDGLLEVGASKAGVTAGQMQEFQRTASAIAERGGEPGAPQLPGPLHPEARACGGQALRHRVPEPRWAGCFIAGR